VLLNIPDWMLLFSTWEICLLDHHTTWIWSLVVTQPITGDPEAGGFTRISPKPWRAKGWHSASILIIICYRQKPIKVFSTQYFVIFSEVCCFIVLPVISLPPLFLPIRKLVSTLDWPGSHDREALHYLECAWCDRLESDPKRTNDGWQRHHKTCFLTPAAGSWTIIVTRPIHTWDWHLTRVCIVVVCEFRIQLAMYVDMVYNLLINELLNSSF
jgi:hypothetical protein